MVSDGTPPDARDPWWIWPTLGWGVLAAVAAVGLIASGALGAGWPAGLAILAVMLGLLWSPVWVPVLPVRPPIARLLLVAGWVFGVVWWWYWYRILGWFAPVLVTALIWTWQLLRASAPRSRVPH